MRTMSVLAAALSLVSAAAVAGTPAGSDRQRPDRAPSTMTPTEIAAFNKGLDRAHPQFIKCRKEEVIGSLARKLRVCRTNAEWSKYADSGNQNARDTIDAMAKAPVSGN
ncbi:hypothetical protein ACFQPG_03360 [Sphingomonas sp. GCM10030256]|uniref:hypothetical protein n=1 Tax=Sphingomonas sp. GCM10030256 TaxID=3273427 RepID=UPI00360E1D8B